MASDAFDPSHTSYNNAFSVMLFQTICCGLFLDPPYWHIEKNIKGKFTKNEQKRNLGTLEVIITLYVGKEIFFRGSLLQI